MVISQGIEGEAHSCISVERLYGVISSPRFLFQGPATKSDLSPHLSCISHISLCVFQPSRSFCRWMTVLALSKVWKDVLALTNETFYLVISLPYSHLQEAWVLAHFPQGRIGLAGVQEEKKFRLWSF